MSRQSVGSRNLKAFPDKTFTKKQPSFFYLFNISSLLLDFKRSVQLSQLRPVNVHATFLCLKILL